MPRIPGPEDIPKITARATSSAASNAGVEGQAISGLGAAASNVANILNERRVRAQDSEAEAWHLTNSKPAFQAFYDEKESEAKVSENYVKDIDKGLEDLEKSLFEKAASEGVRASSKMTQRLKVDYAKIKGGVLAKAVAHENNIRVESSRKQSSILSDQHQQNAFHNPDLFSVSEELARFTNHLSESDAYNPAEKKGILDKHAETIAQSYFSGLALKDPTEAYKQITDTENPMTMAASPEFLQRQTGIIKSKSDDDQGYIIGRNIGGIASNPKELNSLVSEIEDKDIRERARIYADRAWNERQREVNFNSAKLSAEKSDAKIKIQDMKVSLENGFNISDEEIHQLRSKSIELGVEREFNVAYKEGVEVKNFLNSPIGDRKKQLEKLRSSKSISSASKFVRLNDANKTLMSRAETDGYELGVDMGLYERTQLDLNDSESFKIRARQASELSNFVGTVAGPFEDSEISNIKKKWDESSVDDRLLLAKNINEMGPTAQRAWQQLSIKGDTVLAYAGAISSYKKDVARKIIEGSQMISNVPMPSKEEYMDIFNDHVGGALKPDDASDLLKTSLAMYASNNNSVWNPDDFEVALKSIAPMTSVNGKKTPVPAGVSPRKFESFAENYPEELVSKMGGAWFFKEPKPGKVSKERAPDDVVSKLVSDGKWEALSNNRYMVNTRKGYLRGKDGDILVFSYEDIAPKPTERTPSEVFDRQSELLKSADIMGMQ